MPPAPPAINIRVAKYIDLAEGYITQYVVWPSSHDIPAVPLGDLTANDIVATVLPVGDYTVELDGEAKSMYEYPVDGEAASAVNLSRVLGDHTVVFLRSGVVIATAYYSIVQG